SKDKLIKEFQKQKQNEHDRTSLILTEEDKSTPYKIVTIRLDSITINGFRYSYHRVFIQCLDSKDYYKTGWILQQDINFCMICNTSFQSFFTTVTRHHCRVCGNIICSTCSNYTATVRCIEELGKVRICRFCYFEQDLLDSYNSLLDGTPIQGRNGSFTEYIAISNNISLPRESTVSDVLVQKEKEKIAMMERCLLEKEISELTLQFDDYDNADEEEHHHQQGHHPKDDQLEENIFLSKVILRDYGQLSIKQIQPHYILKIYSKYYNPINTPNTRSKHCIYVNICSCEDVPYAPKPISMREINSSIDNDDHEHEDLFAPDSIPVTNTKSPLPSATKASSSIEVFSIVFG
ncbi:MAG: FYVE zinc finger domain-containing protein, partial [Cyanobacteria bacterium]|nr:FYVE zinc finger domain-containing protein [Cyanobacteriota bacterium]